MNILITGANGQLGSEFRELSPLYSSYNFFFAGCDSLNICEVEAVREYISAHNIDFIINCAAYTAVDAAEENPVDCDKVNHTAVSNLAKVADEYDAGLIHFSTDYVFDGSKNTPYTEEDPTSARAIYGITKLASERVALAKCNKAMVIRTSWVYSFYGHNFVKTVLKQLQLRGSMGVVYDQIGTPTYAKDLAKFVLNALSTDFIPGLYHYSNEGVCSWFDFAKMVQRFAGLKGEIYPIHSDQYPAKAPRPAYSVLDKTKVKDTYNIKIPYWVDSLEECIQRIQNDTNK